MISRRKFLLGTAIAAGTIATPPVLRSYWTVAREELLNIKPGYSHFPRLHHDCSNHYADALHCCFKYAGLRQNISVAIDENLSHMPRAVREDKAQAEGLGEPGRRTRFWLDEATSIDPKIYDEMSSRGFRDLHLCQWPTPPKGLAPRG